MASLSNFSRRITIIGDGIAENADRTVRRVALVADQVLVSGTPVDTGRARSNWLVQLNQPAEGIIEAYVPGEFGTTGGANTQAALNQAQAAISNYTHGDVIHITNNLPYMQALNDGSSDQAPANFIEDGIQQAVQAVRGARLID